MKSKKYRGVVSFLAIGAMGLSLTACGGDSDKASSASGEQSMKLRASSNTSGESAEGKSFASFAKCLSDKSDGRLELQVFNDATLGTDAEALELAQNGALDFVSTTLFSSVVEVGGAFDLPYLFKDLDQWQAAVDGAPGDAVKAAAAGTGIKILSFDLGGWRDVYGTKAMPNPDSLKGLKLRTIQTPAYVNFFKAVGSVPTPLAFAEVYLALKQGTLDGAETALPSMYDAKQYEVAKNVAITHHGLSSVAWAVSQKTWDKMTPATQQIVQECDAPRTKEQRENKIADADKVNDLLKQQGVKFFEFDTTSLREKAQALYPDLIKNDAQKKLVDEINALAK